MKSHIYILYVKPTYAIYNVYTYNTQETYNLIEKKKDIVKHYKVSWSYLKT